MAKSVPNAVLEMPLRIGAAEGQEIVERCLEVWRGLGLRDRPRVEWFPRKVVPFSTFYGRLFADSGGGILDAVVLAEERRNAPLYNLRDNISLSLVPVIDIGGRAREFADVHFDLMAQGSWVDTARAILEFRARRERLNPFVRASQEPETRLLAQAYSSGRELAPKRTAQTPEGVCYPGFPTARRVIPVAEELVRRGHLRRTFFDRLHQCGRCESRRLSVREECPACRSPELRQTMLVHHYRCSNLAPEERFRQGSNLVCPKCSQQLRHYGKDYDKPGQTSVCQQCDEATSEPAVGFVCMDCDARADGDAVKRIDIHAYSLTDDGAAFLTGNGEAAYSRDLPASLVEALSRIRSEPQEKKQFTLAEVRYGSRQSIIEGKGEAIFELLRRLFLENLANFLADTGSVHRGAGADYFLVSTDGTMPQEEIEELLARSQATLNESLGPQIRVATKSGKASS